MVSHLLAKTKAELGLIHTNNLHLHVNCNETLRERVNFDQTGINGARKATESSNQANRSLLHRAIWIRAANAARNSTACSDERAESTNHCPVPSMATGIFLIRLQDLGVRRLKVFFTRWFNVNQTVSGAVCGRVQWSFGDGGISCAGVGGHDEGRAWMYLFVLVVRM
jgi:hypothetical protein